ncbi:hypothetical protein GGR53DRAFT_531260 [Hypoxylon sp. FL1150]|nr:hypothetical protein GGR53DRAFT_531260 [Hypoxylon sp. FL1150]
MSAPEKQSVAYKKPTVMSAEPSPTKSEKGGGARLDGGGRDFDKIGAGFAQMTIGGSPLKSMADINDSFNKKLQDAVDDVFVSSSSQHTPVVMRGINKAHPAAPVMHGLTSDDEPKMQHTEPQMLHTSASNLGLRSQVSGVDAQNFYPPTACIFVANLAEHVRDTRLEATLTKLFSEFGVVFVKIRRDSNNMPYAFCQYTNEENARRAMAQLQGAMVEGRPCRIEWVKANRCFVMYAVDEAELSTTVVRELMSPYGALAKCETLHPQIQEAMGVRGGVLIEFTRFDASRDVVGAYRHDSQFRVVPYDLKKQNKKPRVDPDEAWLQKYETDRRSIFIGNLPVEADDLEEKVAAITRVIGKTERIQIVRKDGSRGDRLQPIAFGFVEFQSPDMADAAVKRLTGHVLNGCQLRIERKQSKEPNTIRHIRSVPVFPDDKAKELATPARGKGIRPQRSQQLIPAGKQEIEKAEDQPTVAQSTPTVTAPMTPSGPSFPFAPASAPHQYSFLPYGFPMQHHPMTPQGGNGMFPITPQGTPGMVYGHPFWMTPFLQDPSFSMGYYPQYSTQSPYVTMGAAVNTTTTEASPNDDDATTPTKANPGTVNKRLDDA